MTRLVDQIEEPAQLRGLSLEQLNDLSGELRSMIIETVSRTGGHLAANLGAVDLTIALLRIFDVPRDKIVWDVGHQTYAYKILTGRRDRFHTLRQHGGISGFPVRDESPSDTFGVGHAGTALSAALGVAVARDRHGGAEHVIAVVGDAALGCGISFEALNNVSVTRRLIVVLNDNEMSISANVGAISRYLGDVLANPRYNRWKSALERAVPRRWRVGMLRRVYYRFEEAMKSLFLRNVLFEEFGLRYIGPIDGHDIRKLMAALEIARESDKPILIHVLTQKGRGYGYAEANPEVWHGTPGFDIDTGVPVARSAAPSYSDVFGQTMCRLAAANPQIVAITAAMPAGTGLTQFAERFPDRFFDVGISEEHAVVFAAGLATQGMLPFVPIYSTFAQRTVDCVIHDVCLQRLPVVLCLDRAGAVGDDGATHHGVFDIALFSAVPNLVIMQPADEAELANMLYSASRWNRPTIIRYPRGCGPGVPVPEQLAELPPGKADVREAGTDVQLWALGDMQRIAREVASVLRANGQTTGIVNPRFVRPLDEDLLLAQARAARLFVTMENAVVRGGFGSVVEESLVRSGYRGDILRFGWPDEFVPHGTNAVLMERSGLTAPSISAAILARLGVRKG